MQNTCISSTISLRCKGSLSFSFNDYSCFLDDRFDRNPISFSPSSCCSCCANSLSRLPTNPSFLYGLRQSTLIQWAPCRRLILGSGDRCYSRFSVSDIDHSFKERNVSGRSRRLGNGRYGCVVSEERSERRHLGTADEAELMLSLLTEDVGEEYFGVRERNGRISRRVQVEKRTNSGGNCYRGKKKNVGSGGLESTSKCEFESVLFQSMEEDKKRREERREEERESFLRGENHRVRKGDSSCSSYYSFSSLGEFESDTEIQVQHDGFVRESSSGYKRDLERSGEITYDGDVAEEDERHGSHAKEHGVVLKNENTGKGLYAASSDVECDWRKKSEKKLTEVSIEQTESRKESARKQLRLSEVHKSGHGKSSNFHKQYDDREEKSALAVNIDEGTRKQYSQTGDLITGQSESRMKYKQFTEMPETCSSVVKTTASSQKQYGSREENLTASASLVQETTGEHCKTASHITGQDEYRRSSQQLAEGSEIQEIDIRGTSASQRQSETRMKNWEENPTIILGSVDDEGEQHPQASQWVTGRMESRRKSQQSVGISGTHNVDHEGTFISERICETRMKKQGERSDFALFSYPEPKEQHSKMDSKTNRRLESRKESQDDINYNYTEVVTNTQRIPEKKTSSEERCSTSMVKSVEETRERHNLTVEKVLQVGSRKEDQKSTKGLSFREGVSEEESNYQSSLKLNSQSRVQQISEDEADNRRSQAIVTPPPSQMVPIGPLHVQPTCGFATHEFSSESLGSGYRTLHEHTQDSSPDLQHEIYGEAEMGETHGEPLNFASPEDALGSADRLQKSSMRFVGEFVEKVRHEVSPSEVQKEKKTYETKLLYKDEQLKQKGLGQDGSGDSQPKDHDSSNSSQGSATKGPSDEIWDVTAPSIQEAPETEVPEGTITTGNGVVKRTGRSLWNVISDIVRLRWGSRSETHNLKSGRRSSPNQSTSSETWFSGHEPDESNDENVRKERGSMPEEPSLANQQQPGGNHTHNQGEVSSSISSKEKIKHVALSSSKIESGSTSKGISLSSVEETSPKHFEGTSSGTGMVASSFPLPAMRMRRSPVVEEISETGKTDASSSGTVVQIEQPVPTGLTRVSGTEGKDGEVKRRTLQRNNQVLKDRFDEWEEAYQFETEQRKIDEMFMREALLEAKKAADVWEVPVGAVLVQHGKIIARGYNLVEELRDSTAHAEMICIREASNILRTWRLSEATLYVTLEPCPMCAGAILQARIHTVVWGAPNKLLGADGSWIRLFPNGGEGGSGLEPTDKPAAPVHPFHPKITIRRGVLASECADEMQQFFHIRRKKEKKTDPPAPASCLPISTHPSKFFTKMHDAFHMMFCL